MTRITRREALSALVWPAIVPLEPILVEACSNEEVDIISQRDEPTLQEWADYLARTERRSIEQDYPLTWPNRHYAGLGRWSATTRFAYGFGTAEQVETDIEHWSAQFGQVLAVGRSADGRGWTLFGYPTSHVAPEV